MLFWLLKVSLRGRGAAFRNLARGQGPAYPTLSVGLPPTIQFSQHCESGAAAGRRGWVGGGDHCRGYSGDGTAAGVWAAMPGNCGLGALRPPLGQGVLSGVPRSLHQTGLGSHYKYRCPGPHLTESESPGELFNLNVYQTPQVI